LKVLQKNLEKDKGEGERDCDDISAVAASEICALWIHGDREIDGDREIERSLVGRLSCENGGHDLTHHYDIGHSCA